MQSAFRLKKEGWRCDLSKKFNYTIKPKQEDTRIETITGEADLSGFFVELYPGEYALEIRSDWYQNLNYTMRIRENSTFTRTILRVRECTLTLNNWVSGAEAFVDDVKYDTPPTIKLKYRDTGYRVVIKREFYHDIIYDNIVADRANRRGTLNWRRKTGEWRTFILENHEVPFNTVRQQDDTLYVGEEQVVQEGQNGMKSVTVEREIIEGKWTGQERNRQEQVTRAAVDKIIKEGTKPLRFVYRKEPDEGHAAATSTWDIGSVPKLKKFDYRFEGLPHNLYTVKIETSSGIELYSSNQLTGQFVDRNYSGTIKVTLTLNSNWWDHYSYNDYRAWRGILPVLVVEEVV